MKTVTGGMTALWATRQFYTTKLFTFTLFDGTVLRYCSFDQDIILPVGGDTYSCGAATGGPFFERAGRRAKTSFGLGCKTTSMVFDVIPGAGEVLGAPFTTAVRIGLFDGADFRYHRLNMPTPGDVSCGAILMFAGQVGDTEFTSSLVTFRVGSHLSRLDLPWPRNLVQAGCMNTLYDASCTLNQNDFAYAGTVAASPVPTASVWGLDGAAGGQGAGAFSQGKVKFTSGADAGLTRYVQIHAAGTPKTVSVFPPFPVAPAAGDAFTAYYGCDKFQTTCSVKFNNLVNNRSLPFVPQPETAV